MLFMFPLSKSVSIHAPYIFLSFVLKAIQFYIKPPKTVSFWLILCMYVNMTVFPNMSSFQFSWLLLCIVVCFFLKYFIFSVNFSAHSLSACLHSQRRGWRSEFAAAGGNIKCFAKEPPHPQTFCPSLSTVLDSRLRRKLYQRATSSFSGHLFGHGHRMLVHGPSPFFACYQQQVWHIVALRHVGVLLLWHHCMLVLLIWAVSITLLLLHLHSCSCLPTSNSRHHHTLCDLGVACTQKTFLIFKDFSLVEKFNFLVLHPPTINICALEAWLIISYLQSVKAKSTCVVNFNTRWLSTSPIWQQFPSIFISTTHMICVLTFCSFAIRDVADTFWEILMFKEVSWI